MYIKEDLIIPHVSPLSLPTALGRAAVGGAVSFGMLGALWDNLCSALGPRPGLGVQCVEPCLPPACGRAGRWERPGWVLSHGFPSLCP